MPDQLDQSGASSTEGKHCPVEWIIFCVCCTSMDRPTHPLAHIGHTACEIDPQTRRQRESSAFQCTKNPPQRGRLVHLSIHPQPHASRQYNLIKPSNRRRLVATTVSTGQLPCNRAPSAPEVPRRSQPGQRSEPIGSAGQRTHATAAAATYTTNPLLIAYLRATSVGRRVRPQAFRDDLLLHFDRPPPPPLATCEQLDPRASCTLRPIL